MTDHSKEDLVLHGRQTPLWDKAAGSSSRSVGGSRARTYSVDNYTTGYTDPESSQSSSLQAPSSTTSSAYAASPGDVTSSCSSPPLYPHTGYHPLGYHPLHPQNTMHKSVSFQAANGGVVTNGGGGLNGQSDSDHSLPRPPASEWYTRPVHLEQRKGGFGVGVLETNPANLSSTSASASVSSPALSSPDTPPIIANSTMTVNGGANGVVAEDTSSNNGVTASSVGAKDDKLHYGNTATGSTNSSNGHHHHHHHHHHSHHRSSGRNHHHKQQQQQQQQQPRHRSGRRSKSSTGERRNGGDEKESVSAPSSASSIDTLVHEFFPVTLGAAYMLNSIPPTSKPLSPPPKALPQPNNTPWKVSTKPKSPGGRKQRHNRPGSAHSSSSSATSRGSVDKMYFMTAEAPHTAGVSSGGTVLLSSPYQSELARLRMERLRIEEEHLLEVKRNDELERIRGPQPKWYELKSARFHYEAKKNNEVIKNKPQWQELMDYRADLERASKEYRKSFPPNTPAQPPGLSSTS